MDHATALLDRRVLLELSEYRMPDEPDPALEIAQTFLDVMPERLARMRQAATDGNSDEVRRLAHQVRGSCAAVGAVAMQAVAATLESLDNATAMPPLVLSLESLFARTRPLLEP